MPKTMMSTRQMYGGRFTALALLAILAGCGARGETTSSASDALGGTVDAEFVVTGLARKCIDFGGAAYQAIGSPVILYGCNGSIAQKLHVVEIPDGTRDVSLRAGTRFCLGVRGGTVVPGHALELQTCNAASAAQRFALDGDAIYVGTQTSGRVKRDLVVEVLHGRAANSTPLVVGTREIDDAEDFRFASTVATAPYPTSGFVRVETLLDLDVALLLSRWGSVLDVIPTASIVINDTFERTLGEGVTIRGNRRGTVLGPWINRKAGGAGALLTVTGSDARVTGLQLRGPNTSKDDGLPKVDCVFSDNTMFHVTVDHNEMSAWTGAAVHAQGPNNVDDNGNSCAVDTSPLPLNARVIKNFIHDNAREGAGYGVQSAHGSNVYVDGNHFARNRHAVSSDSNGHTQYTATYNLVTESNYYCSAYIFCWKEQDIDVHGSDDGGHFQGGIAGDLYHITNNSLYTQGKNIDIRGTPCNTVFIDGNVFVSPETSTPVIGHVIDSLEAAIKNGTDVPVRVQIGSNAFSQPEGTRKSADFDGDGVLDEFMGTGAAWYYRPAHKTEWRFLNRATEHVEALTFGDWDGDGRTDVRRVNPIDGLIDTSWGGSSPWDRPDKLIYVGPIGGPITKVR